tara:strand:+ start:13751 stop:13975 length:225 start_codon:yes stop_codon:yes gene_type:complete
MNPSEVYFLYNDPLFKHVIIMEKDGHIYLFKLDGDEISIDEAVSSMVDLEKDRELNFDEEDTNFLLDILEEMEE